jgi:puromycin-sensitive aminopeptidase
MSTNPYRLPATVVPSAYRIFLTPDLEAFTFAGRVEIDVDVREAVTHFALNAVELTLDAATLTSGGVTLRSDDPVLEEQYQTATFAFGEALPIGPATLEIAFTGILNDHLHGFYRSTYTDHDGVTHVIATTQFESTDARRAFPCWDEPAYKATYQVNLTVPSHLQAYSNSPETSNTDLGNGQRLVTFAPTMVMSTYLVAFIVGPFEATDPVDVDGTPLRIVYPKGKGHLSGFALEIGAFALRWFAQYFGIPYPGDKMDMVAIPDFAFGAMENLGCVTYRETALLVDPDTASHAEKLRVAEVVAHELAHMWFGDLVTMEWWEGIWLNEAFATFMEVKCVDAWKPQWKMWTDFGTSRNVALATDGLHSTRPIEYEVISPDDSQGMFDVLTYQKGGSVLRMLDLYLGETTFRDGIRRYLRKHAYANTVTTDLWDALEEESGEPVRDIMNTWILQGGHPLVSYENGALSQSPFAYGAATGPSAIGSQWRVPVRVRDFTGQERRYLLRDEAITVDLDGPVVVNAGGSGVFRTRYGTAELAALAPHIAELNELERFTLVADAWASLFASKIAVADFLAVAEGLDDQDEPSVWSIVAQAFSMLARVADDEGTAALAARVRTIFGPQLARLGFDARESDSDLTPQLRAIVIGALGTTGQDEAVRAECLTRFDDRRFDGNTARELLRVVATVNRPGDYDAVYQLYKNARTPQEEQRFLQTLTVFPDEALALATLDRALHEVRSQDGWIVTARLMANPVGGPAAWRTFVQHWDEAQARFPRNAHDRMMSGLTTFFTDPVLAAEVEAFHTTHPVGVGQRTVLQQLEELRVGLAFAAHVRDHLTR